MSAITGLAALQERLDAYQRALDVRLAEAVEVAGRQMQAELVAVAPVRDGDLRAALDSSDAMKVERGGTRDVRVSVGFLTSEQKKRAFHAFFVEFGTKGYKRGQRRFAGKDRKSGRSRFRAIARDIPARPAHPFFRPAYLNLKRNLARLRAEAHARALLDMRAGTELTDRLLGGP